MATVHELARLADDGGPHADADPVLDNDGNPYPYGWDSADLSSPDTDPRIKIGPVASGVQDGEWDGDRYAGREDIIRDLIRAGIRIEDSGLNTLSARQLRNLREDVRKLMGG